MPPKVLALVTTFFSKYPLRKYAAGKIIARPGEDLPGVLFLTAGHVIQYDISEDGREIILNTFKEPAFFSISNALLEGPNTFFYAAETAVTARCAPAKDVVVFLEKNPTVLIDLLRRVYKGSDGLLRRLSHVLGGNAADMIRFELSIIAQRFGTNSPSGKILKLTHQDIAERTGLSRETVSRELALLKKKKIIKLGYGTITVPNIELL